MKSNFMAFLLLGCLFAAAMPISATTRTNENLTITHDPESITCKLCAKWKNLRVKCWPARVGGLFGAKCQLRFAVNEIGFTSAKSPVQEWVNYTCADLARATELPLRERNRALKQICANRH